MNRPHRACRKRHGVEQAELELHPKRSRKQEGPARLRRPCISLVRLPLCRPFRFSLAWSSLSMCMNPETLRDKCDSPDTRRVNRSVLFQTLLNGRRQRNRHVGIRNGRWHDRAHDFQRRDVDVPALVVFASVGNLTHRPRHCAATTRCRASKTDRTFDCDSCHDSPQKISRVTIAGLGSVRTQFFGHLDYTGCTENFSDF